MPNTLGVVGYIVHEVKVSATSACGYHGRVLAHALSAALTLVSESALK